MADKDRFGGSYKTYQQPRKSEYTAETMQKEFAIGMGTMAAATTGMGGALMLATMKETPAEKKAREARLNQKSRGRPAGSTTRTSSKFRGGSGGGIFDVTAPMKTRSGLRKKKLS